MEVKLAKSLGFCFGVKRAIKLAQENPNSVTIGPLIHNPKEINRLKEGFNVGVVENIDEIKDTKKAIIRTHGIPKNDYAKLKQSDIELTDATCPFVIKPQQICEQMDKEGYDVVIFGDKSHPEIKGIMSYVSNPIVVLTPDELVNYKISQKIAVVSQTTKKKEDLLKIVNTLITTRREVRVFNTICNATLDNQEAAKDLAKVADIMIVIGGKNSSNTKQLHNICKDYCQDSYLVEDLDGLNLEWFSGKTKCGISAGASTPEWIIDRVVEYISKI
jgi:4-hydroxy-3-methylbut-2-enyl diphosphate reductase